MGACALGIDGRRFAPMAQRVRTVAAAAEATSAKAPAPACSLADRTTGLVPGLLLAGAMMLFLWAAPTQAAAPEVGRTVFSKGATTAEGVDGQVRLIGKDAPIYQGDIVTTGKKSFAVLTLSDGTRMALRPETVFKVEEFVTTAGAESGVMRLFKGGLRTITGFLSKRSPTAYKVRTPVATIGIRGTEFDARICGEDCVAESKKVAQSKSNAVTSRVVARVAFLRGAVRAQAGADKPERALVLGSPVYAGDTVSTAAGGFAVLAFRDETRITLTARTRFKVEDQRYDPAAPQSGSAVFRLIQGGLRAVTGLIGKANPAAVRFETPVATIGIRGTRFDLLCQGDCVANGRTEATDRDPFAPFVYLLRQLVREAYAATPTGDGLFVRVDDGGVVIGPDTAAPTTVNAGSAAFLDQPGGSPIFGITMPQIPEPKPADVPIDQQKLFEVKQQTTTEPGLYVVFYEGSGDVTAEDGTTTFAGAGEAVHAGEQGTTSGRIEPPPFVVEDGYFKAADPSVEPMLDVLGNEPGTTFECDI